MENFDHIQERLLTYESPLNIESAWDGYLLKEENYLLKKRLISGRIYMGIAIGILLLLSGSLFVEKMNNQSNDKATPELANAELFSSPLQKQNSTLPLKEVDEKSNGSSEMPTVLGEEDKAGKAISSTSNSAPILRSNEREEHMEKELELEIMNPSLAQSKVLDQHDRADLTTFTRYQISVASLNRLIPLKLFSQNFQIIRLEDVLSAAKKEKAEDELEGIEKSPKPGNPFKRNFVSLEFFGQGGFYSLNYGRVIAKPYFGRTELQVGLSFNPKRFNGRETGMIPFLLPVSINQTIRIRNEHYLRLGLGPTLVNDRLANEENDLYFMGSLKLGYRFQKKKNPYFFQIGMLSIHSFSNIFINEANRFRPTESSLWGELGIGYKF